MIDHPRGDCHACRHGRHTPMGWWCVARDAPANRYLCSGTVPPSDLVHVDDVIRHLCTMEDTMREAAECMGINAAQRDARAEADGVAKAIDAIRDEFGGTA